MKNYKALIIICSIGVIVFIGLGVFVTLKSISLAGDNLAVRWTIVGAIGSWAGSLFGAIALVISLFALWMPQHVRIRAEAGLSKIIPELPSDKNKKWFTITVKNTGLRAVTINSLSFGFERKPKEFYFLFTPDDPFLLQVNPSFPARLEQGEEFNFYVNMDRISTTVLKNEAQTKKNTPCYIYVREVTRGILTFKTKCTLNTFMTD